MISSIAISRAAAFTRIDGPPSTGDDAGTGGPTVPTVPATPGTPTVPGTVPANAVGRTLIVDLTEATRLLDRSVEMIRTLPTTDSGDERTKDLRIRIFKTNKAAEKRIELHLNDSTANGSDTLSKLRQADAYIEDANWQLAKKPSPDGRFNGVDVPGALRDAAAGQRILHELLSAATGMPQPMPPAPPGPAPWPSEPPSNGTPQPMPPAPPAPAPGTPGTPPSGGDSDYPGEDEFPKDDGGRASDS